MSLEVVLVDTEFETLPMTPPSSILYTEPLQVSRSFVYCSHVTSVPTLVLFVFQILLL